MTLQCTLCALPSGDQPFCCKGCEIVFSILKERDALDHPKIQPTDSQEVIRFRCEITDLFCIYCEQVIEWVMQRTPGVILAKVDYATDLCLIDYNPRLINEEEIQEKISKIGYSTANFDQVDKKKERSLTLLFGISAFFALNIMMFSYPIFVGFFDKAESWTLLFGAASFFCTLPILWCGYPIFKRAFFAAISGFFGMEALITIGVFASFTLSTINLSKGSLDVYFDTLAVIVTLVLFGKMIESKAKFIAKSQIKLLFRSLPKRARVKGVFKLIKEIASDDVIEAFCGEKIVVDGVITKGEGYVDCSLITGESLPIFVQSGDKLRSGSIVIEGSLSYLRIPGQSTLESIVELVEGALLKKKGTNRSSFFVPTILLLSFVAFLITKDFVTVLTMLLISCPCAIGIAKPLAESRLIDALLSIGVVVRNRSSLKKLGGEDHFVFDKTGTLTTKEFNLKTDLRGYESIIKSMCAKSNHPLAKALLKSLSNFPQIEMHVQELMGKGMQSEERYFLGSPKWLKVDSSCSLVFLENGCEPILIDLEDCIRDDAPSLLKALNCSVHLFSGDRKDNVEQVARELNIPNYFGDLSPQQKKEKIEALRGVVAFVGDGINDAAALATADISFVPLNGSDLSSQSADFLLTKDDLTLIQEARRLGRLGQKIVRQNLFWAYFYNMIGIPLAFFGLITPIIASIFMMVSSLIVLFNSKRLQN